MSLTSHVAHKSAIAELHVVQCRPHDSACGPDEHASVDSVAFPLRGTFVKHHSRRRRVVADACHAVFFRANEPYRVSHPVAGGDECLVVEPAQRTLDDVMGDAAFACTHALLEAPLVAAARWLRCRLSHAHASPLELDETALGLFAGVVRAPPPRIAHGRQAEIVEATQIAIAGRPGEPWSLDALARHAHSSPFHLARTFRRIAGMPLHRYLVRSRMAAALTEILDTSREVTAIAMDLGFSSPSHFAQVFRATFGCPPSAVRRHGKISTAPIRSQS